MKKKTGILTLPLNTNYGGLLQCYALQTVLQRLGYDVVVIRVPEKDRRIKSTSKRILVYAKRLLMKLTGRSKAPVFFEREYALKQSFIRQNTDRFIAKHINLTAESTPLDLNPEDFDNLVVGSDQVWRPKYFPATDGLSIKDAYLDFAKDWNVNRLAYAISFGTSDWEYDDVMTRKCATLLKKFSGISVRETDAVQTVKDKFGVDAEHVLDPTLLLDKDDYCPLIGDSIPNDQSTECGYVMSYLLDTSANAERFVQELAKNLDITVHDSRSVPYSFKNYGRYSDQAFVQPPVEDWLRDFRDCSFVITDSFHACVFSIIFSKPFIVIGNKDRGMARFDSLLSLFGLEDRLTNNVDQACRLLEKKIDFENVQKEIQRYRDISLSFLRKCLEQNV